MSSVLRFDEWQDSDGNPVASGVGGFSAPGSIVAVKDVLKTDTFSASVTAGGNVAVTDLSITHAISSPSNKLIISAFFGAAATDIGFGNVGIAVHDGTSLINVGTSPGSRTAVSAGGRVSATDSTLVTTMPSVVFTYSPGDTTSRTYSVRAINARTATSTIYVNRMEDDTDDAGRVRGASALIIQEVAV